MFVRLGSSYINASQIKRITPVSGNDELLRAEVEFIDGTCSEEFLPDERREALTKHVIPAPPGYESLGFWDEEHKEVRRERVIAFAYAPGESECLAPITAERGLVEEYVLKTPSGEVHTYSERFPTEEAYIAHQKNAKG